MSLAASRVSLDEEILISPKVIGQVRWEDMRGFNLRQNIQQEGLRLSLEEGRYRLSRFEIGSNLHKVGWTWGSIILSLLDTTSTPP